jgi:hypothetical protein
MTCTVPPMNLPVTSVGMPARIVAREKLPPTFGYGLVNAKAAVQQALGTP